MTEIKRYEDEIAALQEQVRALAAENERLKRERDELRQTLQATQAGATEAINHAMRLQSEIERRDAAAGEPVAVLYRNGDVLTKAQCGEYFEICCKVETPLYTAAPPAVLPYLSDDTLREMVSAYNIANHSIDAYDEMRAAMGRGAHQQWLSCLNPQASR